MKKHFFLLGKSLEHSFSKSYFTQKFAEENLPYTYQNIEIETIQDFKTIDLNKFSGFNVTIPYKEQIIPYLDVLSPEVKEILAVNTVKIEKDKLYGFNTDAYGFHFSLKPFLRNIHERALILGTGGASKAVAYVFEQLGIEVLFVSRQPKNSNEIHYNDINEYVMKFHKIIVNTTPVGMFPNHHQAPKISYKYFTSDHIAYDLIYNPAQTLFLKQAQKNGATAINGLQMLRLQAEKAWQIWNGEITI
jgi:shikimate dehydrogenase